MSQPWKTVRIVGKPGESVTIMPRDHGDEPPPPVVECALRSEGWMTVRLPQEYFVILHDGPTVALRLSELADGTTVDLPAKAADTP